MQRVGKRARPKYEDYAKAPRIQAVEFVILAPIRSVI